MPAVLSSDDAASASPDVIRGAMLRAYERMQEIYADDGISYAAFGDAVNLFLTDQGVP